MTHGPSEPGGAPARATPIRAIVWNRFLEVGAAMRKLRSVHRLHHAEAARLNLDFETRRRVIFDHWHNCNDLLEAAIGHLETAYRELAPHALTAAGLVKEAKVSAELAERHAAQAEHDGAYAATLRPKSLEKFLEGYGRWLSHLAQLGELDPLACPGSRPTMERLHRYFLTLKELGNSDHTITGRFQELQGALRILVPRGDFSFVTSPNGNSLRQFLDMSKRDVTIYHPIDLWHWGLELMQSALKLTSRRRQVRLRDGLMISILAFRGIRLRSVTSLTLGRSMAMDPSSGVWRLELQGEDVKNRKYISTQMAAVLAPWLDRYCDVERRELLNGARSDAFWINWGGEKLEEKGVDKRIRWQSAKRFGPENTFGTHRFRHCIASTAPIVLPEHPGLAASLLQISHGVVNEHYDRSSDVMALKALHQTIAADRRATSELARERSRSGWRERVRRGTK